jgi:SOS response regulatory protein OraA/RecX
MELSNFVEANVHMLKKLNDETLARSIKQNTQQRGKGSTKRMDPTLNQKGKPKMGHKGPKEQIMFKSPTNHKKHIEKGKERET